MSFWLFFIWTINTSVLKAWLLMDAIIDSKWPIAIDWITQGYIIIIYVHFIISIFFSDLFKLIGAWDCINITTLRVHRWIIWIPRGEVFMSISTPDPRLHVRLLATARSLPIHPLEVLLFSSLKSSFAIIRNKLSKKKNT